MPGYSSACDWNSVVVLTQDKGYDLVVRGQDVNKTSELYTPPKPRLNGSLAFAR